jgi:psp operon transcriptional activator
MAARLFLDELATMSMGAQERLLRAVEYGEVTRVGSSRPIRVDVRIVAATNEHLPALVDDNRFRADLLDRLSFEVITLPPLRAREGDIEVLADLFRAAHGRGARLGRMARFRPARARGDGGARLAG